MSDLKIGDYVKWIGPYSSLKNPLLGWITEFRNGRIWIKTDMAHRSLDYPEREYCDLPQYWELIPNNARLVAEATDQAAYYEAITS